MSLILSKNIKRFKNLTWVVIYTLSLFIGYYQMQRFKVFYTKNIYVTGKVVDKRESVEIKRYSSADKFYIIFDSEEWGEQEKLVNYVTYRNARIGDSITFRFSIASLHNRLENTSYMPKFLDKYGYIYISEGHLLLMLLGLMGNVILIGYLIEEWKVYSLLPWIIITLSTLSNILPWVI